MARKRIKVSRRMLFTWFMLAGFILLFAPQKLTNKFQFAFAHIFRWPLTIGRNLSILAHTQQPNDNIFRRRESQYQNYIATLEEQLRQKHQILEEVTGLRQRFPLEGAKLVPADVTTAFLDSSRSELIINRGKNDGLAEGWFVLGDNGVIGTITHVDSRNAQVRLITDPASGIEVKIDQLNLRRIMQGAGSNYARITNISTEHKVKTGSRVFALKKPGLLDTPIVTATITQCKPDDQNPLVWDITVEPVCNLETISNVAVIIMNPQK